MSIRDFLRKIRSVSRSNCNQPRRNFKNVRLVNPIKEKYLRLFNFLGNKFFAINLAVQDIQFGICYQQKCYFVNNEKFAKNIIYSRDFAIFEDYLRFGVVIQNQQFSNVPTHYLAREYMKNNFDI